MISVFLKKGPIDSVTFDNLIIAGDFNVDLFYASKRTDMLLSFMAELNLCAVDLACYPRVTYTYKHDNGTITSLARSHAHTETSLRQCVRY